MRFTSGETMAPADGVPWFFDAGSDSLEFAYSGDAIATLWWWPMFTPWLSQVREEYVE